MPSRVEIQCECAFTNMNAISGEDLTGVFSSMKSNASVAPHTGSTLRSDIDEARFCRTTVTCI